MKITNSIVFGITLLVGLRSATAGVPVQWTAGNGHWYEAVSVSGGISWTAANTAATAQGGYLATLTSAAEDNFVFSLISSDNSYWFQGNGVNSSGPWIGGFQTDRLAEPAGHWAWVTGETWSYTNWGAGSPNNFFVGEDYLHFLGTGGAHTNIWDDAEVNGHPATNDLVGSYVIEFNTNPVPEPASLAIVTLGGLVLLRRRSRRV